MSIPIPPVGLPALSSKDSIEPFGKPENSHTASDAAGTDSVFKPPRMTSWRYWYNLLVYYPLLFNEHFGDNPYKLNGNFLVICFLLIMVWIFGFGVGAWLKFLADVEEGKLGNKKRYAGNLIQAFVAPFLGVVQLTLFVFPPLLANWRDCQAIGLRRGKNSHKP